MERVILHVDMNNFYASVECFLHPEYREEAVVVAGDAKKRHGIVLAKNEKAKKMGIKTAEPLWSAYRKCSELTVIQANHANYSRFSQLSRDIFREYTEYVEPFGLDEAWLDVTALCTSFQDGARIADEIRERLKSELGLTASIGVSFNKIFAKLGSDMKKPDATTVISREGYRQTVWSLPASELLQVGKKTMKKLELRGIYTIGDLARSRATRLEAILGKWGRMIHCFANGMDQSPVRKFAEYDEVKSVGNSTTTPRDLLTEEDVRLTVYILAESVAERLRLKKLKGNVVEIYIRDNQFNSISRQEVIPQRTNLAQEIAEEAMKLFQKNYHWEHPIRCIGLAVNGLSGTEMGQILLFRDKRREKQEALEQTVDDLRRRFGQKSIHRGICLLDRELSTLNPVERHTVLPGSLKR